jgi:hypothetical protein
MSPRPAPYSAQPALADRRELLFTPGPRLGWVFRDRRELAAPYPEPGPSPQLFQARAAAELAAAEESLARAWRWGAGPSLVLALILALAVGCAASAWGSSRTESAVTIIVLCGPGLAWTGYCWVRRDQARRRASGGDYQQALDTWGQRAAQHEAAELARLSSLPEWGSVISPARRTDIFGGTLAGWQGLLTVHGASILADSPLLAVDLTGQHATSMLTAAASAAQVDALTYYLPQDLARCGLLAELSPADLATAIAEAMHAGSGPGSQASRAVDTWIVQQLASALTRGTVTPRRLAAAARAALGQPVPDGLLGPAEFELVAGGLFSPGYRQEITGSLVRLDAVLAALAAHGSDGWPAKPARCTCLALDTSAPSGSEEILKSLIIAWLTIHVTASSGDAPAVIIAGADAITRPHLERLADACERRGVPLTLMFRYLRDDATAMVGGGTAAFMRLANHHEAEQAATYLGRRHTFVVSSRTATHGGSQTATQGNGDGHGTSDSHGDTRNNGWQGGGFPGHGTDCGGRSRTTGSGTSRSWSASFSQADGSSWSGTETRQRSYEYHVEPVILQNLPEHALLLADRSGHALQLRAVECDPSIITLPGASTTALPPPGGHHYPNVPPPVMHPPLPVTPPPPQHQAGRQHPEPLQPPVPQPDEQPDPPEQPDLPWWERGQPLNKWP